MMGITISLAGNPSIKANKITPSIPNNFAKGSKKADVKDNNVISPIPILAKIQITRPAGAATITARRNTNSVRSNMERIITCPICGFLYGGSSRVNEDGMPFKIVMDNIFETTNVINMPTIITQTNNIADKIDCPKPTAVPIKNIDIIAIIVGKAPP